MKTVAVFGGSFSPVHKGHMEVATGILHEGIADEVWLMPCRKNPLKEGTVQMQDAERLDLLKRAIDFFSPSAGEGKLRIEPLELGMELPSYTYRTMQRLTEIYPDVRFRLVVGADSYLEFKKWKEWEWLEENFSPVVYPRPGYPVGNVGNRWTLLDGVKIFDISSTFIRERLRKGEDVSEFMPWMAYDKIKL